MIRVFFNICNPATNETALFHRCILISLSPMVCVQEREDIFMSNEIMRQEVQEAIQAGENALQSLYAAKDQLNSAKNWGLFDMFGGGFFTSMIKHSKLDGAAASLEEARYNLQIFQRELSDVHIPQDLHINVNGFLSFADFFLDGLIADYLVQSRINDAREQVDDAIGRVETLLNDLQSYVY